MLCIGRSGAGLGGSVRASDNVVLLHGWNKVLANVPTVGGQIKDDEQHDSAHWAGRICILSQSIAVV